MDTLLMHADSKIWWER